MEDYRVYCSGAQTRQALLENHAELFSKLVDEGRRIRLYDLSQEPNPDPAPPARSTLLDPRRVFDMLRPGAHSDCRWLGRVLVHARETGSTQDVLRDHFRPIGRGVVAVAETQSQGRGRRGHDWESPTGCLVFSFACELSKGRFNRLLFVQYLASLAVVESLVRLRPTLEPLLQIKWPNDVFVEGQKVAGVLCEGVSGVSGVYLSVGIGLNVSNDQPTVSVNSALAHPPGLAEALTREEVLACFLDVFETMFDRFEQEGFGVFLERYYSSWLHSNQRVTVRGSGRRARITGLTADGLLAAADEATGEPIELSPDMSSFDLARGIVG